MPITPDLKPNEFELTVICPVGGCLAQVTYGFDKELRDLPVDYRRMAKENMIKLATEGHKEGRHVKQD